MPPRCRSVCCLHDPQQQFVCDADDTARNAGVHVLVTASEREVASPNKANADRFAANVLPVIEQIKASGRHVIACDRQSAQRARRCPRLAAASGGQCR
jgi:hypothetical protein